MGIEGFREIPFNYTSADDSKVVRFLFGDEVWKTMEDLRSQRVTGRSARLLLRFIGDLFVLRRNPYLYQDFVDSKAQRRAFLRMAGRDLAVVERYAGGSEDVLRVTRRCREALNELAGELAGAESRRARIRRGLGAVVGPDNVSFDPFTLVAHATDATDWRLFLPVAVVFPGNESEVAPLLSAIAELGLKAIPRGAGTGLTGGAVPVAPGCVMVNTEKLNRIRGTSQAMVPGGMADVIDVEAGVVTEDAMNYAESKGLVFATDPTSAWACTIGGNIAENAGGKTAVLWGTAIDNIMSFRIAVPGGILLEVERVGHPLRKIRPEDAVRFEVRGAGGKPLRMVELKGSDIRKGGLWKDITNKALGGLPGLQKEGTDGVITSARFILHRQYEQKATFCIEFFGESLDEASKVIQALSPEFTDRGAETLMALEHFDEEYVVAIGYRSKAGRGGRPRAVLLVDLVAHDPAQMARGKARIEGLVRPHENTFMFMARDEAEAARFWADRKKLGAIAKRTNAFKLNEDIVLPLAALTGFAEYVEQYNADEERHNQRELVARMREILAGAVGRDEAEQVTAKVPRAEQICAEADGMIGRLAGREMREGAAVARMRDGLVELFSGHQGMATRIKEAFVEVRSRLIVVATHMHAGDGNVHVNIPVFSNDREMMARAAATADAMMGKAVEMGGVVSGEHGIGITKLKHIDAATLEALARYRAGVDPHGLMNPGKLSDLGVPDRVFTPSFNLLELEARILKHDSLEVLAGKIARCVRCGRCKPDCCVFIPGGNMFYHPRNKNLAVGSVIEALLYDAQRFRSTRFEFLRDLEEVADHCTICHKCLKPCPVEIDTGEVSILEREILKARKYKRTPLATRLTLRYLWARNRAFNAVFRAVVLRLGSAVQRMGAGVMRLVPDLGGFKMRWPFILARAPMPAPSAKPLHRHLPERTQAQALLLKPAAESVRTVFYFPGCGSERQYSDVARAAIYILLKSGTQVVLPPSFICCGFPHGANAMKVERDRATLGDSIIFSQIREMFRYLDFDAVVLTCGTCMEALQGMGAGDIFGGPLRDAGEFALEGGLKAQTGGNVLYHKPCHDSLDGRGEEVIKKAGLGVAGVPHCCSEAGTMALSRPDISCALLARKAGALHTAMETMPAGTAIITNCPSCLTGLGRNAGLGAAPRHLAVELAERAGGAGWKEELAEMLKGAETVNF
jgi:FAD/FMN-containing dehydrogenase/Fe-S oxidoreductase